MFLICRNSRVKPWKTWKKSWKNNKIKPFINKWEGINVLSEIDDLKKFEKNNITFALNVLYDKKERKYPAYLL